MAETKILDIKSVLKNPSLLVILLLGITLRLILSNLPGFKIDVDAWFAWALRINEVGFSSFYSSQVWTNYTPGYLYVLSLLGFIKSLFNLDSTMFYYLLKIPAIISEIILGIIVYNLSLNHFSKKISTITTSLVLLNPALIFNSSIWGQIDGVLTLFMVLSIIFLIKKNLILASIFFGLALLIKPQALAIAPVLFLYIVKNFSLKNLFRISLPGVIIFILASLPFFPSNPISGIYSLIINMIGDYSYTSLFAYNLWGIIGFWIEDSKGFILSYKDWGTILLAAYWAILIFIYFRKNIGLMTLSALATLAFYFLPTRVHERYLYPSLIFLLLAAIENKSKLIVYFQAVLSLIYLLNIYFVYVYYNELFLKLPKVLYQESFYNFLNSSPKLLSIISFLTFTTLSFLIFKKSFKIHYTDQNV